MIEMLVAVAVTLIIMGAVVSLFASVNNGISQSIGSLEVQDQIRAARNLLVRDLASLTANPAAQPLSLRSGQGGFEIIEGNKADGNTAGGSDSWRGDPDDALWFTVHGRDFPSSRLDNLATYAAGEPTAAEVIWFTNQEPNEDRWTLYRRVLPILPGHPAENATLSYTDPEFYGRLSDGTITRFNVSRSPNTQAFNTLSDLEKTIHRHGHPGGVFNKQTVLNNLRTATPTGAVSDFDRLADVAVLENVVGFDVRVWDPGAPLMEITTANSKTVVIQPGDPGFDSAAGTIVGYGAFVDLGGYNYTPAANAPDAHFSSAVSGKTYSTWTRQYDGLGEVADGLDNDGAEGVDDPAERTNWPSHLVPLKAVQITIRVFEPASQTIREITIRQAFTR